MPLVRGPREEVGPWEQRWQGYLPKKGRRCREEESIAAMPVAVREEVDGPGKVQLE